MSLPRGTSVSWDPTQTWSPPQTQQFGLPGFSAPALHDVSSRCTCSFLLPVGAVTRRQAGYG